MELLQSIPSEADYTPVAEHQSQTPTSFYSGPPVLHHVSRNATLSARPSDLRSISALSKLSETSSDSTSTEDASGEADTTVPGIDIWIASDKLVLARPSISLALAIPYRSIALHAVASSGLYLQLSMDSAEGGEADEEGSTIELTLSPAEAAAVAANGTTANGTAATAEIGAPRPVDALFKALSDCADLHPDPRQPGDDEDDEEGAGPSFIINGAGDFGADDGDAPALYQVRASAQEGQPGLPPPMPGSGGWITADNVNEYFDDEGNWKGDGPAPGLLGPGAGTVREREEGQDGHGGYGAEEEGNSDDTKWQRTG